MAVYHFTAKIVSRAKGQSAIAKAAYNARESLENKRTGQVCDYTRSTHSAVLFSGIFAPKEAPDWARDREQLWNYVEAAEKRKDSQLAREIEIALPHELTDQQRQWLVIDFVRETFLRRGMVADVAIHAPDRDGDDRNYHAHILLTTREIGPDGFGEKAREWNKRDQLPEWRERWANIANRYLERFGHEARIDHRTLEAQGIDRDPTTHRGPDIAGMERRGQESDVQERRNREAVANDNHREHVARLRAELASVEREIFGATHGRESPATPREVIREAYERSNSPAAFRDALAQEGLFLARADIVDAHALRIEASHTRTRGGYLPEIRAGDYVAVDTRGSVYALTERITGDSRAEVREFLAPLADDPDMDTVANTRTEFAFAQEGRSADPRAAARNRDDTPVAERLEKVVIRVAGAALDGVADMGAAALDKAADLLGGREPLSPADRAAQAASAAYASWKAAAAVADKQSSATQSIDRERWMSDDEYRKQVMANERVAAARELEERLRREREEQYERAQRSGRER